MRFGLDNDMVIIGLRVAIAEAKARGEADRVQRLESLLAQYKQEAVEMNFDRIRLGREAMTMTWDDVMGCSQAERDRLHELVGAANADNLQQHWFRGAEWVLICGASRTTPTSTGGESFPLPDEEGQRSLSQKNGGLMVWAFTRPMELD